MKRFLKAIGLIFLIGTIHAQLDFIPINADYATFQGSNGKTYTEVYVSFYQSELAYQVEDTLQVAHFIHTIKISIGDSIIHTDVRRYRNTEKLGVNTKRLKQFLDVFALELEPGTYTLHVSTMDEVAKKKGDFVLPLEIPVYGSNLIMSDIELATRVKKAEQKSNFSIKNNLEIFPNPSQTFGLIQPLIYFYFEVYNLSLDEDGFNRYKYHYYITNDNGDVIRNFPEKIKSTASTIIAESGGTNIITLSTNKYTLVVEIEDMLTRTLIRKQREFHVEHPIKRKSPEDLVRSRPVGYEQYLNFTKEQLINEFEKVKYITIDQEKEIFESLDDEGMRRFLAEFWNRRDPDATTDVNEYKRQYFENLEYADLNFSNSFKEGWKTDRGRILLIFGKPDEIERYPSSMDTSPYEIWQYYGLEGGSYFVFADLMGHGSFELLHSTYRNELKDPNWQERISTSR
jgi:GWxTD domain-containing protein